jgi:hypothetical protein
MTSRTLTSSLGCTGFKYSYLKQAQCRFFIHFDAEFCQNDSLDEALGAAFGLSSLFEAFRASVI